MNGRTRARTQALPILELIVIVAILAIAAAFVLPLEFMATHPRSNVSRVKSDQRSLATALEGYYIDHKAYPAWTAAPELGANANSKAWKKLSPAVPTFAAQSARHPRIATLTTPVGYITEMYTDHYSSKGAEAFAYYSVPAGWILWSPGPDLDYDISMTNVAAAYDPRVRVPSDYLLELTYDPSNGTKSNGDLWRFKQ